MKEPRPTRMRSVVIEDCVKERVPMCSRISGFAAILAALLVAGCAAGFPPPPSHFSVANDEFYARVKTIAIAPLATPAGLEAPAPAALKFESLIAALLRGAGYTVVPSRQYTAVLEQATRQQGGYFDAYTGKLDEAKRTAVLKAAREELAAKFGVDAVLSPALVVVDAPWSAQWAQWDGATDTVQSAASAVGSGFSKFMNEPHLFLLEGAGQNGTTKAYSLAVSIEDVQGNKLYANRGGIQVQSRISAGALVPVPRDELFVDEARNTGAVNVALEAVSRAGCYSDFQLPPCNGPRLDVGPTAAKRLILVVQAGGKLATPGDWDGFRAVWGKSIAAAAAARGIAADVRDTRVMSSPEPAVLAVVTVNDYRYISEKRYYWVGVATGKPHIDADVEFYELPGDTPVLKRRYQANATCLPGRDLCNPFPPMTEKQVESICAAIVAEVARR